MIDPVENQTTSGEAQSTTPTSTTETSVTESEVQTTNQVSVEEFSINGDALVSKVKELIHQGNIRRIIVKDEEGQILIEIPFTVGVVGGVVGTLLFPVVAALGAIGALVAHLTVVIERKE